MSGARHRITALTCATLLLAAGCAATEDGPTGAASPSGSEPVNDPALLASADTVQRLARESFSGCYAGMVLDHSRHTMTVYRKPGCDLDSTVRDHVSSIPGVPGVTVVFRDARMSLDDMFVLTRRIMADTGYWKSRGITINGAGPQEDGSGVSVMTDVGAAAESTELSRHYRHPVLVSRGSATAPPAAPFRPSTDPATPSG